MKLSASDFYTYHRPSKCALRVYLRQHNEEESLPGPYEEIIRRLGERHEKAHLAIFASSVDLSSVPEEDKERRAREEIEKKSPVIYQAVLRATTSLNGIDCEIVGQPDFLIAHEGQYVIRDSKMSRRVNDKDHPEILRQLELYGWLYEHTFGHAPSALQVHAGTGEIIDVAYDGGSAALQLLEEILKLKQAGSEPYIPVGWSKCSGCCFHDRCWPAAEKRNDVATVDGVDQDIATVLRGEGVDTVDDLLATFNESSLAELKHPRGIRMQRVGKKAEAIMRMARSMASGNEQVFQAPDIPDFPNYVMFDIEGLPPHFEQLEKSYLWGLQVFGKDPGNFLPAVADFGMDGDHRGWNEFLRQAQGIFDKHGDIPFVHWHSYEKTHINMYIKRYGDYDEVAARVLTNLLDLFPITKKSVALPLPSYSLKVIEKYIGFERTQDEYGGDWSMAKYIEATETEDEKLRSEVMEQILTYNQEDLEATWAVLQWLKGKTT